jgi:hypothetical protein
MRHSHATRGYNALAVWGWGMSHIRQRDGLCDKLGGLSANTSKGYGHFAHCCWKGFKPNQRGDLDRCSCKRFKRVETLMQRLLRGDRHTAPPTSEFPLESLPLSSELTY